MPRPWSADDAASNEREEEAHGEGSVADRNAHATAHQQPSVLGPRQPLLLAPILLSEGEALWQGAPAQEPRRRWSELVEEEEAKDEGRVDDGAYTDEADANSCSFSDTATTASTNVAGRTSLSGHPAATASEVVAAAVLGCGHAAVRAPVTVAAGSLPAERFMQSSAAAATAAATMAGAEIAQRWLFECAKMLGDLQAENRSLCEALRRGREGNDALSDLREENRSLNEALRRSKEGAEALSEEARVLRSTNEALRGRVRDLEEELEEGRRQQQRPSVPPTPASGVAPPPLDDDAEVARLRGELHTARLALIAIVPELERRIEERDAELEGVRSELRALKQTPQSAVPKAVEVPDGRQPKEPSNSLEASTTANVAAAGAGDAEDKEAAHVAAAGARAVDSKEALILHRKRNRNPGRQE